MSGAIIPEVIAAEPSSPIERRPLLHFFGEGSALRQAAYQRVVVRKKR
jgi:hypothetical protein